MNDYLTVSGIYKTFNNKVVLKNIKFSIRKGSFVCILGPSGCGKTTLLKIIAGLEKPSGGKIFLENIDISNFPPINRKCGMVFQSYALFPNLSIEENIRYGIKTKNNIQLENLLSLIDLEEYRNMYPSEISGGMQQRVALARSLATEPKILLLDEPFSALDQKIRINLRNQIKALQKKIGITTIMVTHDQDEAIELADQIVLMDRGEIVQIGSPEELYYNPSNLFSAGFIGTSNIIKSKKISENIISAFGAEIQIPLDRDIKKEYLIFVRPENVKIFKEHSALSNHFQPKATVDNIKFLGYFYRIELQLPTNEIIYSYVTKNELTELFLSVGDTVLINIDPINIKLFDIN